MSPERTNHFILVLCVAAVIAPTCAGYVLMGRALQ